MEETTVYHIVWTVIDIKLTGFTIKGTIHKQIKTILKYDVFRGHLHSWIHVDNTCNLYLWTYELVFQMPHTTNEK